MSNNRRIGFHLLFIVVVTMLFMSGSVLADPALSTSDMTITVGKTARLRVTGASGKVTWKSSNTNVASVSNGLVKAKKPGRTVVSGKIKNTVLTCQVTVRKNQYISQNRSADFTGTGIGFFPLDVKYKGKNKMLLTGYLYNLDYGFTLTKLYNKSTIALYDHGKNKLLAKKNWSGSYRVDPRSYRVVTITFTGNQIKKKNYDLASISSLFTDFYFVTN